MTWLGSSRPRLCGAAFAVNPEPVRSRRVDWILGGTSARDQHVPTSAVEVPRFARADPPRPQRKGQRMSTHLHDPAWPHVPPFAAPPHWRGPGGTRDLRTLSRTPGGIRVRAAWTPHAGYVAAPDPHATGFLHLLRGALLCAGPADGAPARRWLAGMEPALSSAAYAAGLAPDGVRLAWPEMDVLPVRLGNRFVAALHEAPDGGSVVLLAGDMGQVLGRCDVHDPAAVHEAARRMARAGLRVLAVAEKERPYLIATVEDADVRGGFRLLGLLGVGAPRRMGDQAARASLAGVTG